MKQLIILFLVISMTFSEVYSQSIDADSTILIQNIGDAESEYMVVFGDIQYYTNSTYINLYQHSVDWIVRQIKNGKQIKCVLQTGDITHSNYIGQWDCFSSSMEELSRIIPFYSLIGDHDYTWYDGLHIDSRDDTCFNEYLQFPVSLQNIISQFEEGHMENVIIKNIVQGQRLDIVLLEFGPRDEVVDWASEYIKSHPDIRFIVCNHEYLEKGGGRRTKGLKCVTRLQNTSYNTPEQLWQKLIKCNDNIVCVLCGHVGGLYTYTVDTNDFGHEVIQIQHNIQGVKYRYDNWLMLWEFPTESDNVSVSIINTDSELFYEDKNPLFRFRYK